MATQKLQNDEYAQGDLVWAFHKGGWEPVHRTIVCLWWENHQKHYLVENGMGAQELVPESFLMLECRASDVLQPSN